MNKPSTPSVCLAGKFYWPSDEYSVPADNLCWNRAPSPNADFFCVRALHGWSFQRAWYYWRCDGPGIEAGAAERLHVKHGKDVRVAGHCGCPSPTEWYKGLAVGSYHVDTQAGLKALADTIKGLVERKSPEMKAEGGRGEPVAWRVKSYLDQYEITSRKEVMVDWRTAGLDVEPLYTHPASPPDVEAIARLVDPRSFEMNEDYSTTFTRTAVARAHEIATDIAALIAGER